MSHKIFLDDEVVECQTFAELYVLLETYYNYGMMIKIDPDLITLEQYLIIINANPNIENFEVPDEVKTPYDLDEYIDVINALSYVYDLIEDS